MPQRQQFIEATLAYLKTLKLMPFPVFKELTRKKYHGSMNPIIINERPFRVAGPMLAWEEYLEVVGDIYQDKIGHTTIERCLTEVCNRISEWPLSDAKLAEFLDLIADVVERIVLHSSIAYVPIINVELDTDIESIKLANAVLYRGWSRSEFAEKKAEIPSGFEFDVPDDICFLKMQVFGDDESLEAQIRKEIENALRVLRFVAWEQSSIEGTKRVHKNQAHHVAIYPHITPAGHYLKVNETKVSRYYLEPSVDFPLKISKDIRVLFQSLGLDMINGHFASSSNPISSHILVALEWYDSGVKAERPRDALYRYVVSVNSILSWDKGLDKGKEMSRRLSKILSATAKVASDHKVIFDFLDTVKKPLEIEEVASDMTKEELIKHSAERFSKIFGKLYGIHRSSILHGLPANPRNPLHEDDVHNAKFLARNAIRLVMRLISENPAWTSKDDIENWFSQP